MMEKQDYFGYSHKTASKVSDINTCLSEDKMIRTYPVILGLCSGGCVKL